MRAHLLEGAHLSRLHLTPKLLLAGQGGLDATQLLAGLLAARALVCKGSRLARGVRLVLLAHALCLARLRRSRLIRLSRALLALNELGNRAARRPLRCQAHVVRGPSDADDLGDAHAAAREDGEHVGAHRAPLRLLASPLRKAACELGDVGREDFVIVRAREDGGTRRRHVLGEVVELGARPLVPLVRVLRREQRAARCEQRRLHARPKLGCRRAQAHHLIALKLRAQRVADSCVGASALSG